MLAAALSRTHKYLSRKPDGKGGWSYKYTQAAPQKAGEGPNAEHVSPRPSDLLHVEGDDEHGSLSHRLNAGLKDAGGDRQHLGIERIKMPQLSAAGGIAAAFLQDMRKRGIRVTPDEVPVGSLKATQNEVSGPKVLGMAQRVKDDDAFARKIREPVIVSRDGYILDGHHRWATLVSLDPHNKMQVNKVDLPIRDLLQASLAFDGVERRDVHAKGLYWSVLPPALVKGERPHTYISRKATGNPKHPYEYTYQHGQGDLFGGAEFKGSDAAPPQRRVGQTTPKDVTAALKNTGWREGHIGAGRSGFHVKEHGDTGAWVELAYHDYGHAHKGEQTARSEHENRQLEAIKAHLHKQGYTFNEAHFGRHSNVVLVGRWKDEPHAADTKVRKAWVDYLANSVRAIWAV